MDIDTPLSFGTDGLLIPIPEDDDSYASTTDTDEVPYTPSPSPVNFLTKEEEYLTKIRLRPRNNVCFKKVVKPLPLPKNSPLPEDHKLARGRARIKQLKNMTKEQVEAEVAARMEKNRQFARNIRLKNKIKFQNLEMEVQNLKIKNEENKKTISHLQEVIDKLTLCN